jgi:mannose-6-phosphate isomerase
MTIVEKPWGYEKWLEVNDNYVVKEIFIKAGHSLSLQYHEQKKETMYVVDILVNPSINLKK